VGGGGVVFREIEKDKMGISTWLRERRETGK